MKKLSYKIAILALFTAFTVILSYIEFLFPFSFGYGLKLGIANITVLALLYVFGIKEAFLVNITRIIIIGLWFGNFLSFVLSLSGAVVSILVMYVMKKIKGLSIITISIFGAVSHNMAQLAAAFIITGVTAVLYYSPVLIIGGVITGILIGMLSKFIIKILKEILKYDFIY